MARIATQAVELVRAAGARALEEAEIRAGNAFVQLAYSRRARVLVGSALVLVAALVASIFVSHAQQQRTLRAPEHIGADDISETREVGASALPSHERERATPDLVVVAAPVVLTRPSAPRAQPAPAASPAAPGRPEETPASPEAEDVDDYEFLLEADRCGRDPTCGI
jgi:hypothetical protein